MKKLGLSVILSFVLVCSLVITGCGCNVAQPVIEIQNGCYVAWAPVDKASGYEVAIDDYKHETTSATSFNLIKYLQRGNLTSIRVRALGSGLFHSNSEYSEPISLSIASTRMDAPENLEITNKNNSYTLTWNSVFADTESKIGYCIKFVGADEQEQYFHTESTKFEINGKLSGSGEFRVSVFAYVPEVTELAPSEFSEEITFEYLSLIATPQAVELKANNILSWVPSLGVKGYNVSFIEGDTTFVTTTSVDLEELSIHDSKVSDKNIVFAGVQAVNKSNVQYSSPYSNFVSLCKNKTDMADFSNCKYTYCGEEFDFCANDYDELEQIVHFTLFYRIESVMFCVDPSYTENPNDIITKNSDRSCAVATAISTYAEIMNIMYNYSYSDNSRLVVYTINIDYNHPEYARKLSLSEGGYVQNEDVLPTHFSQLTEGDEGYRGETFDDFKVNRRAKTAEVYSSDQLYYILDKGCKPIFPGSSNGEVSPALIAYETAKSILREIIDNTMSDYQKVLAIYEWVCYNVKYDINLYNMAQTVDDGQINIYNYRGFYIEGVLFDNGKAVCDGIAKTFSLMCGLENIPCYKVIGLAGVTNPGEHAWSKVALDLAGNDNIREWYTVDATWADYKPQGESVEILTHRYFLKTDEQMAKHEERDRAYISKTLFDYYENTTYDGVHSLLITNDAEMIALRNYLHSQANKPAYIEIKYENSSTLSFSSSISGYTKYTVTTGEVKNGDRDEVIYLYIKS